MPIGDMSMSGSRNVRRLNAPLAWRLKIDDLHAHLAPIDRYGPTGLGSAIAEGVRALTSGWKTALRSALFCSEGRGPDCEVA
jgi:hypothetical protein